MEPPTSGPIADPILYKPKTTGESFACFFKGMQYDKIVVVPLTNPAAPIPETALPIIRAIEFGATAEMMEPASKTTSDVQYIHFIL